MTYFQKSASFTSPLQYIVQLQTEQYWTASNKSLATSGTVKKASIYISMNTIFHWHYLEKTPVYLIFHTVIYNSFHAIQY